MRFCCGKIFTRLNNGIETWFSFYGSYLGVVATTVLGLITIRLSIKIDKMNQASQISNINVLDLKFYDLWSDLKTSIMERNNANNRYCFQIEFEKYQLYYNLNVKEVEWGIFEGNEGNKKFQKMEKCSAYFEQKENACLYIFCNEFEQCVLADSLNFFYYLLAYEPITMEANERKRILKMHMEMEDKLFRKHPDKFNVVLEIVLENKEYKDGGIRLECLNYDFRINI